MHDVRILGDTMNKAIVCVNCPEKDTEASYEWHDYEGTVYFDSNSPEDLVRFLQVHPMKER